MPLRVSALLITYQQERFVDETLRSILEQTHRVDEIVVVDDGSTDGTLDVVRRVADDGVRVISLPHRGIGALAESYEAGLASATGDLVSLIEGDDRWRPEKVERHVAAFADPRVVLTHGPYAVIGAQGATLRPRVPPPVALNEGPYDAFPHHLRMSYVMPVTVTIRRAAIVAAGGFAQVSGTPHIDYPTFLRLSERGLFFYTDEVLAEWRKHGGSGTTQLAGIDLAGADLCRDLALAARSASGRSDLPAIASLRDGWDDAHGRQIWNAVRLLLRGRRYGDARAVIARSRGRGYGWGIRARLALAGLAARTHLDLEALARIGRGTSPFDEL